MAQPALVAEPADFHIRIVGTHAAEFEMLVQGYSTLRERLMRGLPAATVTDDVAQIRRNTRLLAAAIRRARPGAVQGEFFTPAASAEFKVTLDLIMNASVWAVIMDDNPGAFAYTIDGAYPEGKPRSTMPGVVLQRLPHLPDDIEFRFAGTHLILYDVMANTIIDQLPDAIGRKERDR
jgi:hypothetical protein